jgi:hypothetical protein
MLELASIILVFILVVCYRNYLYYYKQKYVHSEFTLIPSSRKPVRVSDVGTVVVTGGLGFLGSEIVKQLLDADSESKL